MDNSKEYLLDLISEPLVLVNSQYEVLWNNKVADDLHNKALELRKNKEKSERAKKRKRRDKKQIVLSKARTCYELLYLSHEPCLNCPVSSCISDRMKNVGATTVDMMGRPIFIETSITCIKRENGDDEIDDLKSYLCLCRNITSSVKEKIKLEAQVSAIARARAVMESGKVSQLITDMGGAIVKNESVDEIQILDDSYDKNKSEIMLKIARDLRTQMNGVMGMTQLLRVCKLEENVAEYVDLLGRACDNLNRVIDNIHESARTNDYEATQLLPSRQKTFKLSRLMRDIGINYSAKAEEKNLELLIHSSPDMPDNLVGDYDNIYQALSFALENAMLCANFGNIDMSFSIGECRDISIVLIVRISIGSSNHDSIESSYCDFSIVDKRCRALDGRLNIEKSSLKMEFPLKVSLVRRMTGSYISDRDSRIIKTENTGINYSRPRLLIADRDVNTRIAIKMALRHDYELYFAKSGVEAMEMYVDLKPDVFIVDILLPEIDGFDILDEINNRDVKSGSVIAMTEMIVKTEPEYLSQYGFDDYISKPVKPGVLRQIVDMRLNGFGLSNKGKRKW